MLANGCIRQSLTALVNDDSLRYWPKEKSTSCVHTYTDDAITALILGIQIRNRFMVVRLSVRPRISDVKQCTSYWIDFARLKSYCDSTHIGEKLFHQYEIPYHSLACHYFKPQQNVSDNNIEWKYLPLNDNEIIYQPHFSPQFKWVSL